jgi:hypothetical protein
MSVYSSIPIPSIFTTSFHSLLKENPVIEQMAPLRWFEVSGPEMVMADPEVAALFDKIGWGSFFFRFSGHNTEVTRQFAFSLKDDVAQIGGFQLMVTEDNIAKATNLPQTSERWFKGSKINKKQCKSLFLPLPAK